MSEHPDLERITALREAGQVAESRALLVRMLERGEQLDPLVLRGMLREAERHSDAAAEFVDCARRLWSRCLDALGAATLHRDDVARVVVILNVLGSSAMDIWEIAAVLGRRTDLEPVQSSWWQLHKLLLRGRCQAVAGRVLPSADVLAAQVGPVIDKLKDGAEREHLERLCAGFYVSLIAAARDAEGMTFVESVRGALPRLPLWAVAGALEHGLARSSQMPWVADAADPDAARLRERLARALGV